MVLIEVRDLEKVYVEIQEAAVQDGGITVLILVAPDCDAMCTCRILTDLMRGDRIQYKVKPVAGYSDITAAKAAYIDTSEELRSIVMLNCGGRVNLAQLFGLSDQLRCFVLDHHRPLHLANVHAGREVCVINDGGILLEDLPGPGPDLSEASEDEDEDDAAEDSDDDFFSDDAAEEEEEEDGDDAGGGGRRKRKSPSSSPGDSGGAAAPRKRMSKGRARRERRQELKSYYLLASHGKPSSHTAYTIAQQLNKESNALLWLAIVGASSHFMAQFTSEETYETLVAGYHDDVKQHNPQTDEQSSTVAVDNAMMAVPVAFDQGKISHHMDFRFMLHRHWSLYDSMFYSDYVGSQLQIWTAVGKQNLERLLARVGIPLQECRQQFCFMSDKMKTRLRQGLEGPAREANLQDIFFETFSLQVGYGRPLSAADLVHSVTALLESQGKAKGDWEKAFYQAYDALSWDAAKGGGPAAALVDEGFRRAKLLQQAVVAKATMVMEKDMVTYHGRFRSLVLDSMSENDNHLFTQPLALARLARFIVKAHKAQNEWIGKRQDVPLVMFALDERTSSYLVVGLGVGASASVLPVAFKYAAADSGAEVKFDGFDNSVVEVPKQSMQAFKLALYDVFKGGS